MPQWLDLTRTLSWWLLLWLLLCLLMPPLLSMCCARWSSPIVDIT